MAEVTVLLPRELVLRTAGESRVSVQAATVGEMIEALEVQFPGFKSEVCADSGELNPFVAVHIPGDSHCLEELSAALEPGKTVSINFIRA